MREIPGLMEILVTKITAMVKLGRAYKYLYVRGIAGEVVPLVVETLIGQAVPLDCC